MVLRPHGAYRKMGKEIANGTLRMPHIDAGRDAYLRVPYKLENINPDAEYFLRILYKLKESAIWADKGFEVASEQFKLPMNTPPVIETKSTQPIKINQNSESVKVTGEGFALTFDKKSGFLSQLHEERNQSVS